MRSATEETHRKAASGSLLKKKKKIHTDSDGFRYKMSFSFNVKTVDLSTALVSVIYEQVK